MKQQKMFKIQNNLIQIHSFVRIECVLLSILLVLGIFVWEIPHDVVRASFSRDTLASSDQNMDRTMLCSVRRSGSDGVQAEAREIRGQQARLSNIAAVGKQGRQENLRTLVFLFLLLTGAVLLTLKQVSVRCYHSHSHGKVSIVRFIHLQDGQK